MRGRTFSVGESVPLYTLTPTLSLSEGEGATLDPLAPEGGEGQGEGALTRV